VASDRDVYDLFGHSVSISDNYAIVGADWEDEDETGGNTYEKAGSVYVFKRNESGEWNEVQKIVASDRFIGDWFGSAVNISGNQLVVGTFYEDHDAMGANPLSDAGSAYIFQCDESGEWTQVQKIVASDRAESDFFGISAGISANHIVIGAVFEDEDASGENFLDAAGSVYVFESCTPGTDPDPDNVIENGNFEACTLSPWSLYFADYLGIIANATLVDGTCCVSGIVLIASPENWHVQLNQELIATQIDMLEKDSTYVLTFDAFAETDDRQCRISFEQSEDPWTNLLDENIFISTETGSYSYEFAMDLIFSEMKLSFQLGLETSAVVFDNVKLTKKVGGSTTAVDHVQRNKVNIFPNPASDHLTIESGSEVSIEKIELLDITGRVIETRDNINANTFTYKLLSFHEGIYILSVYIQDRQIIRKIILTK